MKKVSLIVFIVSLLLAITSVKILDKQGEKYPGDAISGHVEGNKYYFSSNNEYIEVSKSTYYFNISLWICMLFFGLISGISGVIAVYTNLMKPAFKKIPRF